MSKFISVFHRSSFDVHSALTKVERILREITPEIAEADAERLARCVGNHVQGTLNLPQVFPRRGLSLCQGKLYEAARWWVPGSGVPDGSYAIVREDEAICEAVTDPGGTRSVWYYFDDDVFAVSNSQRAITMYVGRFDFDPAVVPWMVASGSLGPRHSYNRHLRLLPPASTVAVDRARWTPRVVEGDIRFDPVERSEAAHLGAVDAALRATFASFDEADRQHATVSLSGGVDSRATACLLAARRWAGPWRSFGSGGRDLARADSDGALAMEVARRLGTSHRFVPSARMPEPEAVEAATERFVLLSEGRHDQLWTYLDGIAPFRPIVDGGARVFLRGEQGFCGPVMDRLVTARRSINVFLCGDFADLAPHLARFGLEGHRLPPALELREGETAQGWHGRLYRAFRIPAFIAALNETKTYFLDIVSPLMSARALAVAASLPDPQREDKALFRRYVRQIGPDLPFAGPSDGPRFHQTARTLGMERVFATSLGSSTATDLFGPELVEWTAQELAGADRLLPRARRRLHRAVHGLAPAWAAAEPPLQLGPLRLAARLHIATRMVACLEADARRFAAGAEAPARVARWA